jgi:chitin disaccharide deacetylase
MPPTPYFPDAVRSTRSTPQLCLGVHLSLCCEWSAQRWAPIAGAVRVPSLVDREGFLLAHPRDLVNAGARIDDLLRECDAQLAFARAHGCDIRYADTHMLWDRALERAGCAGLDAALRAWCARRRIVWYRQGPVVGLPPLPEGGGPLDPIASLLARVERAPAGSYWFVTHPCWPGDAIAREDTGRGRDISGTRLGDYRLLADRHLRTELQRRGVELITYG